MSGRLPAMIGGVCVAFFSAMLTLSVPAQAKCFPNRANDYLSYRWSGWMNTVYDNVGGVYANVWNYSPWVYAAEGGFPVGDYVSSWVMLSQAAPLGQDQNYIQVGWQEWANGYRKTWEQHHFYNTPGNLNNWDNPQPTNTYTYYEVLYGYDANQFTMFVAGHRMGGDLAHSNGDVAAWFVPNQSQVFGETHSADDQMPGGYSTPLYYEDLFDSSYWYGSWKAYGNPGTYPGSGWPASGTQIYIGDQNGLPGNIPGWFGYNYAGGNNFSTWDRKCPQ